MIISWLLAVLATTAYAQVPAAPTGFTFSPIAASANVALYAGCNLYGTGDSVIDNNISTAPVDANSNAVITAVSSNVGNFDYGGTDDAKNERVNLATDDTSTVLVSSVSDGHNPVFSVNPLGGGGAGQEMPWVNGFYIQGKFTTNGCGDCHALVLNTSGAPTACTAYQGGGFNWTAPSGPLVGFGATLQHMGSSYTSQYAKNGDNVTVSGIPMVGFTDFGEEASSAPINHPLEFISPPITEDASGYVFPATSGDEAGGDQTCGGYKNCLIDGDLIRLKASFECPTSNAAILSLCNQLKNYGAYRSDSTSPGTGTGLRFGLDTSGVDDWYSSANASAMHAFLKSITLTNFDIIQRGTIHGS